MRNSSNPSQSLEGKEIEGGWVIGELIGPKKNGSGGNFCSQYIAERGEDRAFLKAIDLTRSFNDRQEDWTKALEECLSAYHFEKDLYLKCREKSMSRVVVPISHGFVDSGMPGLLSSVPYILFEEASEGDLRAAYGAQEGLDAGWAMQILYNTALGIFQLHQAEIAHQDVKPSNVLVFSKDISKISDLGRASDKKNPFKWDSMHFAGDSNYAPIEFYFGISNSCFEERYAADLYMLGSLVFFHFLGVPLNGLIFSKIKDMGGSLGGASFDEALPFLMASFSKVLSDLESVVADNCPLIKGELIAVCKELCLPDPKLRGNRKYKDLMRRMNSQRYVGKFNLLCNMASRAK